MVYDISTLWIWLLAAVALGAAVGWMTRSAGPQGPWFHGWLRGALVVFALGLVAAIFRWLPGKSAFWLEFALLEFVAYILGCLIGGPLSQVFAASGVGTPAAGQAEPAASGPVEGEDRHEGVRPPGLVSARGGVADDLKRVKGVGSQNEGRLHALGVWHFAQIAAWTPDNTRWIGSYLAFPGRIDREQWIAQARELAAGRETEFSLRVESGEVEKGDEGDSGQDNIADLTNIRPRD